MTTARKRTYTPRRGKYFPFFLPQQNPPYPFEIIRAEKRRQYRLPRGRSYSPFLLNTFPQTTCQNNILVDQPQAYWPMRYAQTATGTNEVDYSGWQHDLTWTITNPTALNEVDNAGIVLAADRTATRAFDTWEAPSQFTCEWWMQSSATGAGFFAIFSRRTTNDRWAVYVNRANGTLALVVSAASGAGPFQQNSTGNVLDGNRHHCVVEAFTSGSNVNYQFYIDGVSAGTGTIITGGSITLLAEPMNVCGEGATRQYQGNIAQVAFYNYPLSLARVQSHYNCPLNPFMPLDQYMLQRTRPRRFGRRPSRPISFPIPQAAAPPPPAYPPQILQAEKRRAYRVPRPRTWVVIPPQAAAPPPPIVLPLSRTRLRRGFRPRRGAFFYAFLVGGAPPPSVTVIEPIRGVLVTDGRTSGILVTDGHTTGVLVTDGRTVTFIIS